jgi:hypothetical protein
MYGKRHTQYRAHRMITHKSAKKTMTIITLSNKRDVDDYQLITNPHYHHNALHCTYLESTSWPNHHTDSLPEPLKYT